MFSYCFYILWLKYVSEIQQKKLEIPKKTKMQEKSLKRNIELRGWVNGMRFVPIGTLFVISIKKAIFFLKIRHCINNCHCQ